MNSSHPQTQLVRMLTFYRPSSMVALTLGAFVLMGGAAAEVQARTQPPTKKGTWRAAHVWLRNSSPLYHFLIASLHIRRAGPINRISVAQQLLRQQRGGTYLELGVETGASLWPISRVAKRAVAVDPQPVMPRLVHQASLLGEKTSHYQMTSDAFFQGPAKQLALPQGIDLAFVDGMHSYEQSLRDVNHCLAHLNPGGWIMVHDCMPPHRAAATPAASLAEAEAKRVEGWTGAWTGDVWKTIVTLRATWPDLFVAVLNADFGIGLITKGTPESMLGQQRYTPKKISTLTYDDLVVGQRHLLNLKDPQAFATIIARHR